MIFTINCKPQDRHQTINSFIREQGKGHKVE